jgi:hypothetical protein
MAWATTMTDINRDIAACFIPILFNEKAVDNLAVVFANNSLFIK